MNTAHNALILANRQRALTGSSRSLSRAYNQGELVRVRAGAYYGKPAWLALKPWQRYSATVEAVAAIDPSVRFCYLTALRIWRLPSPRVPLHVHILTHSPHKAGKVPPTTAAAMDPRSGVTGLESVRGYGLYRHHWPVDVTTVRDLRVSPLVQTVIDCVVRLEFHHAVAIADHVVGNRRPDGERLTPATLEEASASLQSRAKRLRFLEVLKFADPAAESVGESRSRALIHVLGFPAPILQHAFYDNEGFIARTDFFWPEAGLIGEFDGDGKYLDDELLGGRTAREAILAEKKREDRLRALGYKVVRWDWDDTNKLKLLERKLTAAGLTRRNPRRMD